METNGLRDGLACTTCKPHFSTKTLCHLTHAHRMLQLTKQLCIFPVQSTLKTKHKIKVLFEVESYVEKVNQLS